MNIQMIAFDMDGTLLGANAAFLERNAKALQACEKMGVKLVFCSGRSYETLRGFALAMGVKPALASVNGARIDETIDGPTLFESTFDDFHSHAIHRAMREADVYFMCFGRGRTYMGNRAAREGLKKHHHEVGVYLEGGCPYEMVDDEDRMLTEGIVRPYKYVAFGLPEDPRFAPVRERALALGMSVSSSWNDNVEIMMPGVDKGSAMRFLSAHFGIPRENIMAFGDNTNDLPMLEAVGWPVAMGNGVPETLAAARIIAPHHAEAGVAQALEKYVLEGA